MVHEGKTDILLASWWGGEHKTKNPNKQKIKLTKNVSFPLSNHVHLEEYFEWFFVLSGVTLQA